MEAGWEQGAGASRLTPERLERLAGRYAKARRYVVHGVLPGGLVNANVRVSLEDPGEDVVLRVYLRDGSAAAKEEALLARLAGTLPVPRVLGGGLDAGTAEEAPLRYLVTTWVPGVALTDVLQQGDAAAHARAGRQVGRALATLHATRYARTGFLDDALRVVEPFDGVRATVEAFVSAAVTGGLAGRRLGRTASARLLRYLEAHGPRLDALDGRYALLHADCKPTNVRVTTEGRLTGLLDWEFAWAGPPLFDLGQMFRWPVPDAYRDALLAAYREAGGHLPQRWRLLARLLDLLNLVGFLDEEGERPVRTRDVRALIEATLAGG